MLSILSSQFSLSAIDIAGAAIGLLYIVSEYRADRWFWPLCMLMSAFYIVIDFSSGYFANGSICIYNFVMAVYGILVWKGVVQSRERKERPFSSCPAMYAVWIVLATVLLTVLFRFLLALLDESQYPLLDGLSSALTIVGMVMMTQKWWQQWFCWMIVEPIMVLLFWRSGNYASAMLYVVYECFCILGIVRWRREYLKTLQS